MYEALRTIARAAKLHLRRSHPTERWQYGPDTFLTSITGKPAWWTGVHEQAFPGVVAGYQNNRNTWEDALLFTEEEVLCLRWDHEVIRAPWASLVRLEGILQKHPFSTKSISLVRTDGLQLLLPTYASHEGAYAVWSFFQYALAARGAESEREQRIE